MKDFNELLERQRCPGFLPPPSYRGRGSLLSDEMWDFSCGFFTLVRFSYANMKKFPKVYLGFLGRFWEGFGNL
jgi:hypothetical protein